MTSNGFCQSYAETFSVHICFVHRLCTQSTSSLNDCYIMRWNRKYRFNEWREKGTLSKSREMSTGIIVIKGLLQVLNFRVNFKIKVQATCDILSNKNKFILYSIPYTLLSIQKVFNNLIVCLLIFIMMCNHVNKEIIFNCQQKPQCRIRLSLVI